MFGVLETTTVRPGLVQDFYRKTPVMQEYFGHVMRAEQKLFGDIKFSHRNSRLLVLKSGDLNFLEKSQLEDALSSDVFIVFGSSFIKGWLVDFLVEKRAINIHMGLSPYYRGSSCNFWALYDERPEMVGATIHLLSRGLDSGPMLYHVVPECEGSNPFEFTMGAVVSAQKSLVDRLYSGELAELEPIVQDRSLELRYTRNSDFTDEVARSFLDRNTRAIDLTKTLESRQRPDLLRIKTRS